MTPSTLSFDQQLTTLIGDLDFPVLQINLSRLYDAITANPAKYGFSDVTAASPSPSMADGFLYWFNGIDPTLSAHTAIADYITAIVTAPSCVATLAEQPMASHFSQSQAIRAQLFPLQTCRKLHVFYPFVSGSYSSPLTPVLTSAASHYQGHGGGATLGGLYPIFNHWLIGAAVGMDWDRFHSRAENNRYQFSLVSDTLSLFTEVTARHFYLDIIGNASYLNFDRIHRTFHVAASKQTAHGHTIGAEFGGEIDGAYFVFHNHDGFQTGPMFDVDYQYIRVHGYREKRAEIGNLVYKKQHFQAVLAGIGWEANLQRHYEHWTLTLDTYLSLNRQWSQRRQKLQYAERTLSNHFGSTSVRVPDASFGIFNINLNGCLRNGLTLGLGYINRFGQHHIRQSSISANLSFSL